MASGNLPAQWTRFIGRDQELENLKGLLHRSRLVTITGAGGCGKTRLALQVAGDVEAQYRDGAWWVDLASLREAGLLPQTIAQAISLHPVADRPVGEQIFEWVSSRHLLLVLDNCEHLVGACAQWITSLLARSSQPRILATSRMPLGLHAEVVFPLAGLPYPPLGEAAGLPQADIQKYASIHLFSNRVQAILPDFAITEQNSSAIRDICRRLDGLPLALELAGARANILTPQQIASRLNDRFNLLVSNQPSTGQSGQVRHQALRAAIDWSYDLLTETERILLTRLAVFPARFSLSMAEKICTDDSVQPSQLLDLVSSLVNQSLLQAHTLNRDEAAYSLLETIREYALEKLSEAGEWVTAHDRHLNCIMNLAEECEPKLTGPYQRVWLDWLEEYYGNIRGAFGWAAALPDGEFINRGRRVEAALRIAIAIYQFWVIRDHVEEGLNWYERLLELAGDEVSATVRGNAMAYASFLAGFRGRKEDQMRYGQRATLLAEQAGEQGKIALKWALSAQFYAARSAGDHQTEYELGLRLVELNRELGDRFQLGLMLSFTSFSAMTVGAYDVAQSLLDECLPIMREAGNPYRIAMALNYIGDLARCRKNYGRAKRSYQESISLLRELSAARDLASALQNLGHACLHLGEINQAAGYFQESLALQQSQQNTPGVAECLLGFATLATHKNLFSEGARLLSAVNSIGGPRVTSTWAATRLAYEETLALAKTKLTDAEFQAEWARGSQWTLDEAVAFALTLAQTTQTQGKNWKSSDPLSVREREVVELIAQGLTNPEISDRLVVSKRTVEKHIAHILDKLGFENRAQIVRWGIETRVPLKPSD